MNECVLVEWVDVFKVMNDEPFNEAISPDDRLSHMKTIGWVYKETVTTLMLVQEYGEGIPHDWVVIPKGLITKRTVLK